MKYIGYYNPHSYPVQFINAGAGNPVIIEAGSPVVNNDNMLVPYGNAHLDKQVGAGLLKPIHDNHPTFKQWNEKAALLQKSPGPLARDQDGFPIGAQIDPSNPHTATKPPEVHIGYKGIKSPADDTTMDELHRDAQQAIGSIPSDVIEEAEKAIKERGEFIYDQHPFKSVSALKKYIEETKGEE